MSGFTLPPFSVGAALIFWGWQSGNAVTGALLALALEFPLRIGLRFAFSDRDYARIADLCTVAFVALVGVLAANRGISHGFLAAFQWLPLAVAPILLAQRFGSAQRIPLTALFRYLRKAKERDPDLDVPAIDVAPGYLIVVLLAAGLAEQNGRAYFAAIAGFAAWILFAGRPRHGSVVAWLSMFAAAVGIGYLGQLALTQMQAQLEAWISDWHLSGMAGDPYRSTTDIGSVGRLKLLDAIVLRVYAPREEQARVRLLHRASFDQYVGTTWIARNAPLDGIGPSRDGASWELAPGQAELRVRIATRLEREKALLSLPAGTLRIEDAPFGRLQRNRLGAVQAEASGDWIHYTAELAAREDASYAAPGARDLDVPTLERAAFDRLARELGLEGLPPPEAVRRVMEHFSTFAYSTWRESSRPAGITALADFMEHGRSGHCEYFAAASVLLLRAAGIPARYATGFAVVEFSPLEAAFLVRARHAHAWTRAWIDGRWQDIDTTPAAWVDVEESNAPVWEALADLLRWAGFRWSQRGEFEAGWSWYALAAGLALILAWRLTRGKRARGASGATAASRARPFPGGDSELFAFEAALHERGFGRRASETAGSWAVRVSGQLAPEARPHLTRLVELHQRYRFDPRGLSPAERSELQSAARDLRGRLSLSR